MNDIHIRYPHKRYNSPQLIKWLAQSEVLRRVAWKEYKSCSDPVGYLDFYGNCVHWANFGWECCIALRDRGYSITFLDGVIDQPYKWVM